MLKIIWKKITSSRASFLFLVSLFSLTIGTACSTKHSEIQNSDLLRAKRLIDNQQTDEAIELLEQNSEKNSTDPEYRVTLASAYAHKAGIRIQSLSGIVHASNQLKKINEQNGGAFGTTSDYNSGDTQNRTHQRLSYLSKILAASSNYFLLISTIPTVPENKVVFIKKSIKLMNDSRVTWRASDITYRLLLEIIYFKYSFSTQFLDQLMEPSQRSKESCTLDIQTLSTATMSLGKQLIDILSDYALIYPQNKEQILDRSNELSQNITNLAVNLQIADGVDLISASIFSDPVLSQRVGGFVRCGGHSY